MPELGEYFVVRTNGWAAEGIRIVTDSDVNHAGVYVGDGMIVEAQPAGARMVAASIYPGALWSGVDITEGRGEQIAAAAKAHIGDRYSWIDCACIGVADVFGWHVPQPIRDRLADPHMNMCSQLVDRAYLEAGVHLFTDGRIPGDVSPQDLRALITNEEDAHA